MGDPRHDLGLAAEQAVADWLEASGWRIMARRHRSRSGGEVDLIGLDPAGVLVAIEVRARRAGRAGHGSERIGPRRTARSGRTLAAYAVDSRVVHVGLRTALVSASSLPGPVARWLLRRVPNICA